MFKYNFLFLINFIFVTGYLNLYVDITKLADNALHYKDVS